MSATSTAGTARAVSGRQYSLASGPYEAQIASVGASLRTLTWHGRHLVLPYAASAVRPNYAGAVLAPWPNRVGGGAWSWQGQPHQLPLTEPERGHALHGLALWLEWQPVRAADSAVTLAATIWPQPGYPFLIDLQVDWELGGGGLSCRLTATNGGEQAAPYGCAIHPYLRGGSGRVDDWWVSLPAGSRLELDAELLPTTLEPVAAEADFRARRRVGGVRLDHAYTNLRFDDSGHASVRVVDDAGDGVAIEFGERTPWVQLHTTDRPGSPMDRTALAVEPMTCPPDALRSGTDLILLQPGESGTVQWRIAALAGAAHA